MPSSASCSNDPNPRATWVFWNTMVLRSPTAPADMGAIEDALSAG
jgi:hypothetical protein